MDGQWFDLVDPDVDELLAAVPDLDPDAIEILTAPARDGRDARPSLESHGPYLVGVFLLPIHDDPANTFHYRELACIVTPDRLVTIRKRDPTGEHAPIGLVPTASAVTAGGGRLLRELVDDVAGAHLDLVDDLYAEIDELEDSLDHISSHDARRMLSDLRHEMLHARKNVSSTRAAIRRIVDGRLSVSGGELFPPDVAASFADTYDTLVRTIEELDVARDLLASVRDYLQARVSESQNEIVKTLTVVASLVLVPTLITGFFGQNFESAFDHGYWSLTVSTALIVVTTLAQLVVFRWRRWI
ncbi:MAG: CorA family divalent cation transporter [Gaiellales bacterium]